jgi:Holliday junction resolvasome RuvABC ATP-dependent DNA helicase subunit
MIDEKLLKEINEYCKFNGINDIDKEINNFIRTGFNIAKYGLNPIDNIKNEYKKEPLEVKIVKAEPIEENTQDKIKKEVIDKPKKTVRIIKNK